MRRDPRALAGAAVVRGLITRRPAPAPASDGGGRGRRMAPEAAPGGVTRQKEQIMSQNTSPHLTITLTGRPPVRILKADWPLIASATDDRYDSEHQCQANREAAWALRVRQHADGRAIVYAVYHYTSRWAGEPEYHVRAGHLLAPGADIPAAILALTDELETRMPDDAEWGHGYFQRLGHECVAALPAVEI